jgi:hypothetical protein
VLRREAGVDHLEGFEHALAEEFVEGLPGRSGDEHPQDVRADVVQPPLARLVQQGRGGQPADPLVRVGRHLRLGRTAAEAELTHLLQQRLRPRGGEVHAPPQPERQEVAERDRPVRRDGVAVERPPPVDEHPPIGQLGQQVVDRVVEAQAALLDQDQRADRSDRLGHRGDAEDAVALDGRRFAPAEAARPPHLDVVIAGRQPGDAADVVPFDVAGHDIAESPDPPFVESTHMGFDPTPVPNSSVRGHHRLLPPPERRAPPPEEWELELEWLEWLEWLPKPPKPPKERCREPWSAP